MSVYIIFVLFILVYTLTNLNVCSTKTSQNSGSTGIILYLDKFSFAAMWRGMSRCNILIMCFNYLERSLLSFSEKDTFHVNFSFIPVLICMLMFSDYLLLFVFNITMPGKVISNEKSMNLGPKNLNPSIKVFSRLSTLVRFIIRK